MNTNTITCPNCGANTTNRHNCEYCGSLLVRFVDANIDVKQTPYGDDSIVLPGLVEQLKQNLAAQKSVAYQNAEQSWVSTDMYVYSAAYTNNKQGIACVMNTNIIVFQNDVRAFPEKVGPGLAVSFSFCPYVDESLDPAFNAAENSAHQKFKQLACFPLFKSSTCVFDGLQGVKQWAYEYAIDFGEDAEGAARLLSDIAINVFGCDPNSPIECHTNVGAYAINKSREAVTGIPMGPKVLGLNRNAWILIAAIAIIGITMFLFTYVL